MATMTKEQAMEKFMLAKKKKQERIETLAKKITYSEVKSAHSIDNDVLRAISSELTNEM
jgi:hypothetical protein